MSHDWPYGEPIVVVIEGGLVQGVLSPSGSAVPVVVIDYGDKEGDGDTLVPQPEGGLANAWVTDYGVDRLHPTITDFIHNFLNGD